MRAQAVIDETIERPKVPSSWDQIDAAVPQLAITMLAYLAPSPQVRVLCGGAGQV